MHVESGRIAAGILARERRFMSRAITLTESTLPEHTAAIGHVLRALRATGHRDIHPRPRIAITGPPGVGKSCLIEAVGMHIVEGLRRSVGVLAVDPSDADRGGSVLGDKTRMSQLSMHPDAFVRPSPSRGALGGVTARAWEALEVFEAADFDVTIVETVGVGQSEIEARHLTDVFVLLVPPLGGDDLQGVKRGIVQAADIIAVTKADDTNPAQLALAEQAASYYRRASSLVHSSGPSACPSEADAAAGVPRSRHRKTAATEVCVVSAHTGYGIPQLTQSILNLFAEREADGSVGATRQLQRLRHFRSYFEQSVVELASQRLREDGRYEAFENQVVSRLLTPREAGDEALARLGFVRR